MKRFMHLGAAIGTVFGLGVIGDPVPRKAAKKRHRPKTILDVADRAGANRARARLADHRKAQAERLKDALEPVETRQQRRAKDRARRKSLYPTPTQFAHLRLKDKVPTYSRRTFVNHRDRPIHN